MRKGGMGAHRALIRDGRVLTMDERVGDFDRADVLVEDGTIAEVAADLEAEADLTINAEGKLVLPGLIDSHIHLWQTPLAGLAADCWGMEYFPTIHPYSACFRPDDVRAATFGGALLSLMRGVTTVVDFCHTIHSPEHADAAVDALERSGVRAFFGYSLRHRPEAEATTFRSHSQRLNDARRVAQRLAGGSRVSAALALNNIEHVDAETNAAEIACARELGMLAMVHTILPGQVAELNERGLLGHDLQFVHAIAASDAELDLLARQGGTIAVTPEVEAGLMASVPVIGRALRAGVPVAIGVDVPSGVSIDLLAQARLSFTLDRMLDAQSQRANGHQPTRAEGLPALDPRRVLGLCTIEAAKALGVANRVGSLTPGKAGDVTVIDPAPFGLGAADPAAYLVSQSSAPADVEAVLVDGRPRVLDGELVGEDLDDARGAVERTREHVIRAREGRVAA